MLEALWELVIEWGLFIYGIVGFERNTLSLNFSQTEGLFL